MAAFIYKNIPISYNDQGNGQTIVLLHGFLENKNMWTFFSETFLQNFRIITIDLLGHGETPALGYLHTMEENALMVLTLLKALNITRYTVIGHSMGGYIALEMVKQKPTYVQKIVLLNSTSRADSAEKVTNRNRAIKAVKKNHETFVRLSIANLFSDDNRKRLQNNIENIKLEALKTPIQGIISSLEGMKIREDNTEFFNNIKIPKLLILGKQDAVLPFQETAPQIQNSTIKLIEMSGGHMSHLENKEDLIDVLKIFLL